MITKRQKQILDFISKYELKNEFAPSLKEIKKHFKLSSESTVHQHIDALKKKGYLNKSKNKPRGIELNKTEKLIEIPIVGVIAAGQPIEALEIGNESVSVLSHEIENTEKHYALKSLLETA